MTDSGSCEEVRATASRGIRASTRCRGGAGNTSISRRPRGNVGSGRHSDSQRSSWPRVSPILDWPSSGLSPQIVGSPTPMHCSPTSGSTGWAAVTCTRHGPGPTCCGQAPTCRSQWTRGWVSVVTGDLADARHHLRRCRDRAPSEGTERDGPHRRTRRHRRRDMHHHLRNRRVDHRATDRGVRRAESVARSCRLETYRGLDEAGDRSGPVSAR
jgi:hypothetical protein